MTTHALAITAASAIVCGVAGQVVARRLRIPAIAPLLVFGVLLGPDLLGVVQPAEMGDGLRVVVGMAVAIILFEGGLSLKAESFRLTGKAIRNLVVFGALMTWAMSALFAALLFPDIGAGPAVLFGALVIVTGPTVIQPLIHAIHPRRRIADILRGEGILIDPVGALCAVLVFEFLVASESGGTWHVMGASLWRILLGIVLGAICAFSLDRWLRRQSLDHDIRNLSVLAAAIGLYVLSEAVSSESGVLTVTVAGFLLGVLDPPGLEEIEEFKGYMTVLMVSTVFILLSASLDISDLMELGWRAVVLVALIMLIARPITIFVCTHGTDLSLREKLFLSWIAPRGIVAAAVSSLFALELGTEAGVTVMNLTFAVIVGTVMIQGPTAAYVGRFLGVLEEERNGFLIIGGNIVGKRIGRALHRAGFRVLLLDTNDRRVDEAREMGLHARRANALDRLVMEELDLDGIGNLLAVTTNDSVNRLAVRLYEKDFGSAHVRAMKLRESPDLEGEIAEKTYVLGGELAFDDLALRLAEGQTIEKLEVDSDVSVTDLEGLLDGAAPVLVFDANSTVRYLSAGDRIARGSSVFYVAATAQA